ncbi:MAG: GGDEF domain-containing protein [Pseudobutyrivibrio sp.]|nr:GGDEF domain-containing protein [Pseudobutyrivibrio sp.]
MSRRFSLTKKSLFFAFIIVLSVLILTGLSGYASQMSIYREQSEEKLQNTATYLAETLGQQGDEFIAYQELYLEVYDKVLIPIDFDGNYIPAKNIFYEKFNEIYPGKSIGGDIQYSELTEELKILYVTYKHEYYMYIFNNIAEKYGIAYTYYLVPTKEDYHMYYVIDAVREPVLIDGTEYILLADDIYEAPERHEHMWSAWYSGEFTPGYDTFNNQYGKTYACYYPLVISNQKLGVVGTEIDIEAINNTVLKNSIRQVLIMSVLVFILGILVTYRLYQGYVKRIVKLENNIAQFTKTKDFTMAGKIEAEIEGNDEITDLEKQTSEMISEILQYVINLTATNNELTETKEKMHYAYELANKDTLTGVRNKTAYDLEVQKIEFQIAQENFEKFGIAMVDLNYLKLINDNFGHDKGNISIKKICGIVCVTFAHSPVFRIGGDEFVVIFENADYDNIENLVADFKDTLKKIAEDDTLEPWEKVSAAIGWTKFNKSTDLGVQNVFKRADNLMYENKKSMKATRV